MKTTRLATTLGQLRCSALAMVIALGALAACNAKTSGAGADAGADASVPQPPVPEFGWPSSRQLRTVATVADGLSIPRDLAFHPDRPGELWVVNRATDGVVILFDPATPTQRAEARVDAFANHFMEEVASLAFGAGDTFATCGETRNTYDGQAAPDDFMGPALWPADLALFAVINQDPFGTLLGSHLDMLHQSPLCMGVAHDAANAYYVFDGLNGHIVYYDFRTPHAVGGDDHADGIVHRLTEAAVTRVPDVVSHLVLDQATGWLYVADTGGSRVLRVDTRSGGTAGIFPYNNELLAEARYRTGVTVETFVTSGLTEPSGIAINDGRLFVSDHATGDIVAYALVDGAELDRVTTGLAGIMGIEIGPEGRLWFVDAARQTVMYLFSP